MMARSLVVWIDQTRVGRLSEQGNVWSFSYGPAWLNAPDSFDLSPALARSEREIHDGSSFRPVQWFFDNLLPEEG